MNLFFGILLAFLTSSASAAFLPRQNSVHLVVTPNCGTLSGSPASINAGLKDLNSFDTIVAFGDSYTSGGVSNGSALAPAVMVPPNPSAGGRVSNGKLWIEHLAATAGATLHDYAVKGSVIDAMEYPLSSPLRQQKDFMGQVTSYLSSNTRPNPDTTLFVVFMGTRDYENRQELTSQDFSLTTGALTYAIADLTFSSGVKNFLFVDNYGRGEKTSDGEAYKQSLFDSLRDAKANTGISFAFVDLYPLWNGVLSSNPGHEAFGFTSPGACTVNAQTMEAACHDPEHTFYWIPGYPSASTHGIMAEYVEEVLTQCTS